VQHDAAHAGAEVDKGAALGRERDRVEQRIDVVGGRRLVVRRVLDRRPDRLGIELAEKDERLGRDAVVGVVAPAGALGGQRVRSLA
jgi:uncharacterized protein YbjQ (UPF0145 family)